MKNFFRLAIGIAGVLSVWWSTVYFIPRLAQWIGPAGATWPPVSNADRLGQLGAVGDMFGAINALFSGLALGAIALTLWLESKSRKEARKPLVICGIDAVNGVIIDPPTRVGARVIVPVHFEVEVSNQTDEAALNVGVRLELGGAKLRNYIDGPLIRGGTQVVKFEFELSEDVWQVLLTKLTTAGDGFEVRVTTDYRSLERVDWVTVVDFVLVAPIDTVSLNLLNSVRNDTWATQWLAPALVGIESKIKQGSWDHYVKK